MAKSKLKTYTGDQADVTWEGALCIHVGECGRAEGALFEGGRDPWCDPNVTSVDNVADVVERCPTGALTYASKDGGPAESPAAENTILVANHGPLYVRGNLQIDGGDAGGAGSEGVKFRAALCRCGKSANKPFCDNAHEKDGFQDRGAVGQKGDETVDATGPLAITRAANGPLLLSGGFKILNGSGQVAFQGTRAALCRCGQSKNKPFCDGAHKAAGFEAP